MNRESIMHKSLRMCRSHKSDLEYTVHILSANSSEAPDDLTERNTAAITRRPLVVDTQTNNSFD